MKDDPSLRVEQSSEQNTAPEGDFVLVPTFAVEDVVKFLEANRPGQQRETLFPIGNLNLLAAMIAATPNPPMGGETKLKPKEN